MQWQKGQLGQITKLLSGKDRGWRGGVNFTANLSGTPEALRIESQTAIEGFRRYDIVGSENVRLATSCSGRYNAVTSTFAGLLCESPVSGGTLRLRGTLSLVAQAPTYDLTLEAEKVPLTSVVRLLRQAKKQIPGDLTASGLLNAEFRATRNIPNVPGARRARPIAALIADMDRQRLGDQRAPVVERRERGKEMGLLSARFQLPWWAQIPGQLRRGSDPVTR